MKIAVTGGSGFIGVHLVNRLVSEGHAVRVLARKTSNIKPLKKLGVKLVYGDIMNKKSVERLVDNVNVVYHLAAKVYRGSADEFWNMNFHAP